MLRLRRRRQFFTFFGEERQALLQIALAFGEGAGFSHGEHQRQIAQIAYHVIEGTRGVGAGAGRAFGHHFGPVNARQRRGGEIVLAGPEQSLRRQNHHIFRTAGILHQGPHVEIGHYHAQEIHTVIQRRGQHDLRPQRRILHIGAQGAAVLFFIFIEQRNKIQLLHGSGRLLSQDGTVVLDAGKTADPREGGKEIADPFPRRGFVRVEHDPLQAAQFHVDAHHAVGQGQSAGRKIALFVIIHAGRGTDISIPEALGAFPGVFGGLVGTAASRQRHGHQQQKTTQKRIRHHIPPCIRAFYACDTCATADRARPYIAR